MLEIMFLTSIAFMIVVPVLLVPIIWVICGIISRGIYSGH